MRELIRLGTQEVARIPAWKDMRRRRDMASVRVLFSHHLGDDIIKQQKKVVPFCSEQILLLREHPHADVPIQALRRRGAVRKPWPP